MQRTTLTIDGRSYELVEGTALDELKTSIENAVLAGGKFVDVTVIGNVGISILASPGVPIFLTTRQTLDNIRDVDDKSDDFDPTEWEIFGSLG